MSDFGTMVERIRLETFREPPTAVVQDAIKTAIRFFTPEPFWFNEERWCMTAVAGQEYYGLPVSGGANTASFIGQYTMRITVNNNNDYLLNYRTNQYMEARYTPPSLYQGYPKDWAIFDKQLRLGPIPNDNEYLLTLHGEKAFDDLSATSDTNDWMTVGEELIRTRAKWDIFENRLHNDKLANRMTLAIHGDAKGRGGILLQLRKRNRKMQSTGRIRGWI